MNKLTTPASGPFMPYLFAETYFVRNDESSEIMSALEQTRRIHVTGCKGVNLQEKFDRACEQAILHYSKHKGSLTLWGEIKHYFFFYARGRSVLIKPNGHLIQKVVGLPTPATKFRRAPPTNPN